MTGAAVFRTHFRLLLLMLASTGCARDDKPTPKRPRLEPTAFQLAGLNNVYRLTDKLYSGSGPEDDTGFASLKALGVRTILSVDGARPDVGRARRFGMRYVHLPIGYDGVPQEQAWRIARAVRDLPGPIYLHCHHGRHRGPAAAAAALRCLDANCSVEAAVAWMKTAGTDSHYTGLYAAPAQVRRPSAAELDAVSGDFPETAEVAALARLMVNIDECFRRLKEVRAAGWNVPKDHPDLDPPHEALQLVEQYRESLRLPEVKQKYAPELARGLADAAAGASELEQALRRGDTATAEKRFQQAAAACATCHSTYRDVPQR